MKNQKIFSVESTELARPQKVKPSTAAIQKRLRNEMAGIDNDNFVYVKRLLSFAE